MKALRLLCFLYVFSLDSTMATTKPVPSLGPDGFITNTPKMADLMLAHFFASNYSQTHFYTGRVASFAWILQRWAKDMERTSSEVQEALNKYFSAYFSNVVVETSVKSENETSRYAITIYVGFVDSEGKEHSLGRSVNIVDSVVEKIIALNNYGVLPTT